MSTYDFTNSQKCHFFNKLLNSTFIFPLQLIILLLSSSWFSLFKRINYSKEKQKEGGRRHRQKCTMLEMHVSLVSVSAVCPGNIGWVCKWLGRRSRYKRTFHVLLRVLFPRPSPRDRWFTSRNIPGLTWSMVSEPALSRASSDPEKGCPFCPYHFPTPLFLQGWLPARSYLVHLTVQLQHVMQGKWRARIDLFTSNLDFFMD